MTPEEMNEGVRILLDRMDTHPEEFHYGIHTKWAQIISEVMKAAKGEPSLVHFLHPEEVEAIRDKLRALERNEFTSHVLRVLADAPDDDDDQLDLPYIPSIPRGQTRFVTKSEMELARKLGVSIEVFLQSKRAREALK